MSPRIFISDVSDQSCNPEDWRECSLVSVWWSEVREYRRRPVSQLTVSALISPLTTQRSHNLTTREKHSGAARHQQSEPIRAGQPGARPMRAENWGTHHHFLDISRPCARKIVHHCFLDLKHGVEDYFKQLFNSRNILSLNAAFHRGRGPVCDIWSPDNISVFIFGAPLSAHYGASPCRDQIFARLAVTRGGARVGLSLDSARVPGRTAASRQDWRASLHQESSIDSFIAA